MNYELRITNYELNWKGINPPPAPPKRGPPPILELRIDELRINRIHPLLFTSFTDAWRPPGGR